MPSAPTSVKVGWRRRSAVPTATLTLARAAGESQLCRMAKTAIRRIQGSVRSGPSHVRQRPTSWGVDRVDRRHLSSFRDGRRKGECLAEVRYQRLPRLRGNTAGGFRSGAEAVVLQRLRLVVELASTRHDGRPTMTCGGVHLKPPTNPVSCRLIVRPPCGGRERR